MPVTRQETTIPLIGNCTPEICGNQLPSKKQILQCYFYYTRHSTPKLTAAEARKCVIRKCAIFWEYAEIPIVNEAYAITKLEKLVDSYRKVRKHSGMTDKYENYQKEEDLFQCELDNLFDIAHSRKVSVLKSDSVVNLLKLQRETGRRGTLDRIIDTSTETADGQQEAEGEIIESQKQAQPCGIASHYANYVFDDDEDIAGLFEDDEYDSEETDATYEVRTCPRKPKKLKIMSPNITAILDRAKISDRDAARLLAATLIEAGISLQDVHLSRETVRKNRHTFRAALSSSIRDNAKTRSSDVLTIHWDGKQLPSPENKRKKIDRLPILVSSHEWHQLLGVPRLERGTGELQAQAVCHLLREWDFTDDVCAMVFDTTASNTGPANGACILIEKFIGRDLLNLACRHHMFELLLKAAFEASMGGTSGPDVPIFKRFIEKWDSIDKTKSVPGIHENIVKQKLESDSKNILSFVNTQLEDKTIRRDYREFLELVVIFLGGKLIRGNRFRALGNIHHARWMSKAIYSLKIFLFREEFHLTSKEKSGLMETCIFIVLLYQKAWFTASDAVRAPNNDLILLKQLAAHANCTSQPTSKVWEAVFNKFKTHLWYLSEELIALAFFDDVVSVECKRKMCEAIKSRPGSDNDRHQRRIEPKYLKSIHELTIDSLVTKNTIKFFKILRLDCSFLDEDPTTWAERDDFATAFKIVKSLHVTNDIAERAVALVSEYNDLLTKDEKSKQNLMLIVQKLRESSSGCDREHLEFSLEKYLNNQSIPSSRPMD